MKIAMIGLGKLGLPCAEQMAKKHQVTGYDVIDVKSDAINIVKNLADAVKGQEIIFIAVPTPHHPDYDGSAPASHLPTKDFDYTALKNVLSEIGKYTHQNQLVVIISTVLPSTVRHQLKPLITNYNLIYNPYFIAMGTVKDDFLNPEFIPIGTLNGAMSEAQQLTDFYKTLIPNAQFQMGTWEEVECIKIFYNTFISFKISFVNMIQDVSMRIGNTDVDVVTKALSQASKRLISPMYMTAGMGDGGPCHPRDNIALSDLSNRLDLNYDLFQAVMQSREKQALNLAQFLSDFKKPVTIVGKAFKPGVSLTDGSYSLLVGHYLKQLGCEISYFDTLTGDAGPQNKVPQTYLLAHVDSQKYPVHFIHGSVVVDPWRKAKSIEGCKIIHYGNTRKNSM